MKKLPVSDPPMEPRRGYDLAAPAYDTWYWSEMWLQNEVPVVARWIDQPQVGYALNAGSGSGLYSPHLRRIARSIVSLDVSAKMLLAGSKTLPAVGVVRHHFVQGSIEALPFPDHAFDLTLCTRVLSHIRTPWIALKELSRTLRPGAMCVLTDIHDDHPYECTSIKTGYGDLRIETYKHCQSAVEQSIARTGDLETIAFMEYRLRDLSWKPPFERFRKLYKEPERRLFWLRVLRRLPD